MEKKLVMTFKDETENKFNLTVNSVKDSISPTEINNIMDYIISTEIFKSKNGKLVSKTSAITVDTNTTEHPVGN
ncbi:hypothetical protein IO99_02860 [Clostridium sulfidigenes]|uniref:DUF2922 domain-containing protein n=1 Tax=Clostridium sulfidigenes TaxID=318464 RepID=A0A084JHC8_9CLOT|nr:DUF2922 domain-containing protein [Clostridium sulfidigenes]KEZ88362.1 hypothetical protein IO99_02860 [Clostridium sulfidigenes]